MIPMIAATVVATAIARQVDGYSIYSARLRARPDEVVGTAAAPRPG
jgi:hypothetical protein